MSSFQLFFVFLFCLPSICFCAPTPLAPTNKDKNPQDIPQKGRAISSIVCTFGSILILGPPKSVVNANFKNILDYIEKTKQNMHQFFSYFNAIANGVIKSGVIKSDVIKSDVIKSDVIKDSNFTEIPKECLELKGRTIVNEFDDIEQKGGNLFKTIFKQVFKKVDAGLQKKLRNSDYILDLHKKIISYNDLIEDALTKNNDDVYYYALLRERCQNSLYGIQSVVREYQRLLVDECHENIDCFPSTIKKAMIFNKNVAEEFLNIIALDAVQIQHISLFCDSMVQNASKHKLNPKQIDEHTKILEDTIKIVKSMFD